MKKNQRDEIGVQGMKQDTRFEKTVMLLFKNHEFITTSPLRHRQRGNMTRPPVPKPPATTTYSPDSPARRWFAPLRNRCREYSIWQLDGTQVM
jgi:hypothetical protein